MLNLANEYKVGATDDDQCSATRQDSAPTHSGLPRLAHFSYAGFTSHHNKEEFFRRWVGSDDIEELSMKRLASAKAMEEEKLKLEEEKLKQQQALSLLAQGAACPRHCLCQLYEDELQCSRQISAGSREYQERVQKIASTANEVLGKERYENFHNLFTDFMMTRMRMKHQLPASSEGASAETKRQKTTASSSNNTA